MKEPTERTDLEIVQELFDLLQGTAPTKYQIHPANMPNLTPDQAWTVVWYLGNLYRRIPDHIERCEVCRTVYDTWEDGETNDHPPGPVFVCGECVNSPEAQLQRRIGRKMERQRARQSASRKANRHADGADRRKANRHADGADRRPDAPIAETVPAVEKNRLR